jgi:hypothetical protein
MASTHVINLPSIPKNFDPELEKYLSLLYRVLVNKQLDDFDSNKKLQEEINDLKSRLKTLEDS